MVIGIDAVILLRAVLMSQRFRVLAILGVLLFGWGPVAAAQALEADLELGEEINEVCASCHGEYGEGGKGGEYPRLAGLPEGYIVDQLRLFRERRRVNIPMAPYTEERELPDEDIQAIAAYLARIDLPRKMPDLAPDVSSYERLLIAKKVINIPPFEGDLEQGEDLYADCVQCHGEDGLGKEDTINPPVAGQYSEYLEKQMRFFANGERWHEFSDELFAELDDDELRDLLAYMATLDDV